MQLLNAELRSDQEPAHVTSNTESNRHGILRNVAATILPKGIKSALGARYREHLYLRYLKQKFGKRVKPDSIGPMPPPELIQTEALMTEDEFESKSEARQYFDSGRSAAWLVLRQLDQRGVDLASLRSILEFGCGSARVLRHFRHIDGLRLAGTDANPKPIDWSRRNLPGIDFNHNQLQPPLGYKDSSFDLIYALSVFTHIPLEWQRSWLDELRRILRPGGHLLCTVVGEHFVNAQLTPEDRAKLQRDGHVTLDAQSTAASYSTKVLGSWDVFQSPEEVREVFGKNLELLAYNERPEWHDILVLRKPAGPA